MKRSPILLAILLLIFLLPNALTAQSKAYVENKIKALKQGTLLVKLPNDNEEKIKYYSKRGNQKKVNRLKKRQKEQKLKIVAYFEKHFDFCPVLFFEASATKEIRKRNFEGYLRNYQLKLVDDSIMADKPYLIASFDDPRKPKSTHLLPSLILLTGNFKELPKPFAHIVTIHPNKSGIVPVDFNKSAKAAIKTLNWKLKDYLYWNK